MINYDKLVVIMGILVFWQQLEPKRGTTKVLINAQMIPQIRY